MILEKYCRTEFCKQVQPLASDILASKMQNADAIISMGDSITREMILGASNLKIIADMWGGRQVDVEACREREIKVCGSEIDNTWISDAEAEHGIMMMTALGRRLFALDKFVRSGKYNNYEQANKLFLGQGLYERKLGIIGGFRRTGEQVVRRARALFMDVQYWDTECSNKMEQLGAKHVSFDELIKTSDFILIITNGASGYLFDKPQFDVINHNAFLINVSSGKYINEKELCRALIDGRLAGAGLDKTENEPCHESDLEKLDNVILTPHSDGSLIEERSAIFNSLINECFKTLGILSVE
jgi:phosphoglycerate dehydrogenase-like enzyme